MGPGHNFFKNENLNNDFILSEIEKLVFVDIGTKDAKDNQLLGSSGLEKEDEESTLYVCQFKLLLYAQEAQPIGLLSPTLGQFGVNCPEFCNQFNLASKHFEVGTPLRVLFKVLPDKKFSFKITTIPFGELAFSCVSYLGRSTRRRLSRLAVYRLILIYAFINHDSNFNRVTKNVLGFLRSSRFRKFLRYTKKKNE